MHSRVFSSSVFGVNGIIVRVEVDVAPGMPCFSIVGLGDQAVRESRDRVRAALLNCGFKIPPKKITVNLAPADIKKEGSLFDLPIAIGILKAGGFFGEMSVENTVMFGELSLDGHIMPVYGALSMAFSASEEGFSRVILPADNAAECSIVSETESYAFKHLMDVVKFLSGEVSYKPTAFKEPKDDNSVNNGIDFADVKGQEYAKRVLEITAAGGHNLIMIGPPGSGKSMLAKRLSTILPPMSIEEKIESTKIYSIAKKAAHEEKLVYGRPFRSPHHTISYAGLVGGGTFPRPGEMSLAHNGVLFLDEFPEFSRDVLEVLRQPIEDGKVTISRAQASIDFPASFILAAAMNPCPCGYRSDPTNNCVCTFNQVKKYVGKISGPLLDRIDLGIWVSPVKVSELMEEAVSSESSASVMKRVVMAREFQKERFESGKISSNARIPASEMSKLCKLGEDEKSMLIKLAPKFRLSSRGYHRVLRVSRTIADLAGSDEIRKDDILEAIQYRPNLS